jgi:membrane fusion protein (multidrug efflux system)
MNTTIEEPRNRIVTIPDVETRRYAVGQGNNGEDHGKTVSKHRRRRRNLIVLAGMFVAGMVTGSFYLLFVAPYESTRDAFIEGRSTVIAPQVSGRAARLLVQDNQEVKRGDTLLEIAPENYQAQVDECLATLAAANSRLEQAKAQVAVDQAKANLESANVRSAVAEAIRAKADLQRYLAIESGAVSRSELDVAEAQSRSAMTQLGIALNRALAADAQVKLSQAAIQTARAQVWQCDAAFSQARLNLSYTKVVAPTDGRVMKRSVEQGAYLQAGQAVMAIVPDELWVVANFKETQLTYMRPGQPVEIKLDAYPERKLKGHVDSIQKGAGARFSTFPPEDATDKYGKIVQRVPVKIVFDEPLDPTLALEPGMSVKPEVKVK